MDAIEQVKVRVSPDGRVSRKDAAVYLNRKVKTLAQWKCDGHGPPPINVGGRIFYRLADLESFASGAQVGPTA